MPETIFLRLLAHDDKQTALAAAVDALRSGEACGDVYRAEPTSFRQVPGSPMAYWFSQRLRDKFTSLSPIEKPPREARRGSWAGDDFRYLRIWCEVSTSSINRNIRWVPFAKGGDFSAYYFDFSLLVDWDEKRQTFRDFFGRVGRETARPESLGYYFRTGVTWPLRSQRGFSARVLPAGFIFANVSPCIFDSDNNHLHGILGLTNSSTFSRLLDVSQAFGAYQVGVIQRTPVPDLDNPQGARLGELALACVELKRDLDRANETSHVFHLPALLQVAVAPSPPTPPPQGGRGVGGVAATTPPSPLVGEGDRGGEGAEADGGGEGKEPPITLAERAAAWAAHVAATEAQLAANQREIDEIAFQLYGIEGEDRRAIEEGLNHRDTEAQSEDEIVENDEESLDESAPPFDPLSLCASVVSYLVGCAFGRFDIRYATGERPTPDLPDPFAPLPACSPGMLTGNDGLPLLVAPEGYPLQLDADGILVDAPDHEDDIVRRVRTALDTIFGERAEAIEREACQILGVDELRDYFRRPGKGGFWDDHIKRYSKSRRKAPIYWLLQSPKKNYALWLYYHRLDKDTLFKAQVTYVEPKIRLERERLTGMQARRAGLAGRELRQLEREIERQEVLISDLEDFRDRLVRTAQRYLEPDHNDGVVLTIAPLWELVPWKEAKHYWNELLAGKYEWSSIGKQLREKGLVR